MVLVTGASGLIGSHLLAALIKEGHDCLALKLTNSDLQYIKRHFKRNFGGLEEFNKITWHTADLLDLEEIKEAVKQADHIFHCAAMVSFFSNDSEKMKKVNIHGTRYLVNLAIEYNVKKFVFVSSTSSIGGQAHNHDITEEDKWMPEEDNSNYGLSKYLAELEVWRASEEGLDVAIVNPSIIIGPGNWESSSPVIFNRIYKGLNFYTPGSNAFVDVRDVVSIMLKLGFGPVKNQRFLVCGQNLSFKELFSMVATKMERPVPKMAAKTWMANLAMIMENIGSFFAGRTPFITRETVANGFREVTYSSEKVKNEFNFEFTPIEQSVEHTIEVFMHDIQNKA